MPESADPFIKAVHDIQTHSREALSTSTWQTVWRLLGSVLLVLLSVVLLFTAVRVIALGVYWPAVIAIILAVTFGYSASGMLQSLDRLLEGHYLFIGATRIARLLNSGAHPNYNSVRYFIFGHDHAANARPCPKQIEKRRLFANGM